MQLTIVADLPIQMILIFETMGPWIKPGILAAF